LERIFERFYKTDRSRSGGGTGLGLAIAKHVVHAHGGRIWAESGGLGGATFSFTLPIVQAEASEVGGRESVDDHPHAAVAQTGSRRPTSGP
jgi:signal transduction histidine kinase